MLKALAIPEMLITKLLREAQEKFSCSLPCKVHSVGISLASSRNFFRGCASEERERRKIFKAVAGRKLSAKELCVDDTNDCEREARAEENSEL